MRNSRRDFIKQASLLAGGIGLWEQLPASVRRALEINPPDGTTFYDAEHIIVLMQENRSFDHSFGTLQGVRGFNDPRAIRLPDRNKVWLQTNREGLTYAPFRLNIRDTRSTWMGSLPHGWTDMVDARNEGKMDQWLEAKKPGREEYAGMPLTMGYYNREDIPFYYALADAFTVCDQHFCSSLTGTTPNRLHLWTGTVRHGGSKDAVANVRNSDVTYRKEASWRTFPELLEQEGIPWRIYQNELSLDVGFSDEEEAWLANFTNNPIEWFSQYHVRFLRTYREELIRKADALEAELKNLKGGVHKEKTAALKALREEIEKWAPGNFNKLSEFEKSIHRKAFTTNVNDPDYHRVDDLVYEENGERRETKVPAGDVLHQFREDVSNGRLPTVSWLIAPERFSDHPGSPWYGAWYISEVMDILTRNPEVWKKTVLIVTYDENDGYFDHVPPFVPPVPGREHSGKVSAGIDPEAEYVTMKEERETKGESEEDARAGQIGLGFRVPMIVASPWSRGGRVNSEVFDHTSVLQFLEDFLNRKTGKSIRETNISAWRRNVCGDLSSVFSTYRGEKISYPEPVDKQAFIKSIYNAKFKELPSGYRALDPAEIDRINRGGQSSAMPAQEPGIRDACPLPYELEVNGRLDPGKRSFDISFRAGNGAFGEQAAGAPFHVYAPGDYLGAGAGGKENKEIKENAVEKCRTWAYAVAAGDQLSDSWPLSGFKGDYELEVYGPNGFFRSFKGNADDPRLVITGGYAPGPSGKTPMADKMILKIANSGSGSVKVRLEDQGYGLPAQEREIPAGSETTIGIDTAGSYGWYDLTIRAEDYPSFGQRFAGRVETGAPRKTDPVMGRVKS